MQILGKILCRRVNTKRHVTSRPMVRFSQTWCQKMRKTWKKKVMKRRVAICGGREAVADFVQGGSNWWFNVHSSDSTSLWYSLFSLFFYSSFFFFSLISILVQILKEYWPIPIRSKIGRYTNILIWHRNSSITYVEHLSVGDSLRLQLLHLPQTAPGLRLRPVIAKVEHRHNILVRKGRDGDPGIRN